MPAPDSIGGPWHTGYKQFDSLSVTGAEAVISRMLGTLHTFEQEQFREHFNKVQLKPAGERWEVG